MASTSKTHFNHKRLPQGAATPLSMFQNNISPLAERRDIQKSNFIMQSRTSKASNYNTIEKTGQSELYSNKFAESSKHNAANFSSLPATHATSGAEDLQLRSKSFQQKPRELDQTFGKKDLAKTLKEAMQEQQIKE